MNNTTKNNPSTAPADWFHHLARMELDKTIAEVVGRRHADLRLLVDSVASTVAEVDAVECRDDANWRTLREALYGFSAASEWCVGRFHHS